MLSKVRRFSILVRAMVFSTVIVGLLGTVIAVTVTAGRTQQRDAHQLAQAVTTMRVAQQVKFRIAELSARDNIWAFDSVLGKKQAITPLDTDFANLKASSAKMNTEMKELTALPLDPREKSFVQAAMAKFAKLVEMNPPVIEAYSSGRPEDRARVAGLVRQARTLVDQSLGDIDSAVGLIVERVAQQQETVDGV
jgi:hypothetical protein